MINRRGFLTVLMCAPAIVSFASIMPVKAIILPTDPEWDMAVQIFADGSESAPVYAGEKNFREFLEQSGVKRLRSLSRPWEREDYGLRDDIAAAFDGLSA